MDGEFSIGLPVSTQKLMFKGKPRKKVSKMNGNLYYACPHFDTVIIV